MQLSEKIILRRYNALANDWTPLSRKPCWLSNAFHCRYNYMKRNRFAWFRLPILSTQIPSADNKLHCACDKSFADDLVPSRYCKRESDLCITIRWGFCGVSSICSSLIFPFLDISIWQRILSIFGRLISCLILIIWYRLLRGPCGSDRLLRGPCGLLDTYSHYVDSGITQVSQDKLNWKFPLILG